MTAEQQRFWNILWHAIEGFLIVEIPVVIVYLNTPDMSPRALAAGLLGAAVLWFRASQTVPQADGQ